VPLQTRLSTDRNYRSSATDGEEPPWRMPSKSFTGSSAASIGVSAEIMDGVKHPPVSSLDS
jgi:hypothetical protein